MIIGRGELTAIEYLKSYFGLDVIYSMGWEKCPGIYPQIPVTLIFTKDVLSNLADLHKQSSVDIMVHTKNHRFYSIRVQDNHHKGHLKAWRDLIQLKNLIRSGIHSVIDLREWENKTLFNEILNEDSINYMKTQLDYFIENPPGYS